MTTTRLRGRRLALEPIAMEDLAWFTALNRHPDVRRHLWDGGAIDADEARDIIVRGVDAFAREGYGLWVGRHGRVVVGYYGLWHFFDEPRPQLLYVSEPGRGRRGYAREACERVVAYAFDELGYHRLDAAIDAGNAPSLALARSLGFVHHRTEDVDGRPTVVLRLARERVRPAGEREEGAT